MKVVFTVVTGGYDDLKPIKAVNPEWKYVAIVDDMSINPNGWELLSIGKLNPPEGLNSVYLQRWVKVIGGIKYFGCDTIYIDGTHEVVRDITRLFDDTICFKKHPIRNCVYEEAIACIKLKKAHPDSIDIQMKEYYQLGMPKNLGMFETGIMFRPYNDKVIDFCERWWNEIFKHTHRDQLSITKVLWDTKIGFDWVRSETIDRYIIKHKHRQCVTI